MPDRERTEIERAIARAFQPRRRLTRRAFFRQAARGGAYAAGALSLPSILAACGIGPAASSTPKPLPSSPAGTLIWANWPAYIDIDEDTGEYPTIAKFTDETGIQVTYSEDVNDNEEFFGKIQPDLAAGNPTTYDLIVLTDWMIERMIRLGYLEALDKSKLASFEESVQDLYKDPWYDPGNTYSLAWQSGITGIGYNKKLVADLRPDNPTITKFDDLLDPVFKGQVGMFSEMRDTMSLCLLSMGKKPEDATNEDAKAAQEKLLEAANRQQFQGFYGNDYYDLLAGENLALTIAWSGDVSQMKLYDNPDVEFVIPDDGGMLWVDNMAIPKNAAHPLDAHMMMDFWYRLENAVPLTEYVGYFSPVKGVAEQVAADAETARADDPEWADALEVISETAFPSEADLAKVHNYKRLTEDDEKVWNDLFNEVVQG
ncbi:MAG TPA: spermidine/putrescine ABC transporter substrate-binding protein [Candidatus Limnocylindria bacterium]